MPRSYRRLCLRGQTSEIFEGINAGGMTIRPNGLDGIAADIDDAHDLKCPLGKRLRRILVNISHDVHFPVAPRAGAPAAHGFHRDKAFCPIIPFDGQFPANLLNICWLHTFSDA